MPTDLCLICGIKADIETVLIGDMRRLGHLVKCQRCTNYQIDANETGYLKDQLKLDVDVAILSHAIHKMRRSAKIPLLSQGNIAVILQNSLPSPSEQMNNFVLWLGDNIPGLGKMVVVDGLFMQAEIGAVTLEGVNMIIGHLLEEKLIEEIKIAGAWGEGHIHPKRTLTLRMRGWEYYENLKSGSLSSRKAFMAMQYGDQELDDVVEKYFRPAVKAAGFDLYRLDDFPKAGLIDDRLKVEIRTSRFLIADLTHENRGAYWEAGFAQGLGKPVIYTCETSKFEEQYTHFDTNHHTTIKWDRNNLEKAATDLKNTIRETFPEEAKMTDDE